MIAKFKNKIKKKRGQVEMFGLAIIVVLISLGFFIFISFKVNDKKDSPQKDFTNDKLANDFVLSILEVNIRDCSSFTVKDLIIDCGRDKKNICSGGDSCEILNETIHELSEKIFVTRADSFRIFSVNLPDANGKETLNITYRGCAEGLSQGQRGTAIIPLYPDPRTVQINMNICK